MNQATYQLADNSSLVQKGKSEFGQISVAYGGHQYYWIEHPVVL